MNGNNRLDQLLTDLRYVLHAVAGASVLDRNWAFRYTHCRNGILGGAPRSAVPGFLYQCVSVDNFHDFIRFYHHEARDRRRFIDEALDALRIYRIEDRLAGEASVPVANMRARLMASPPRAVAEI